MSSGSERGGREPLVIAVGNRWRRDDGAGPEAAQRLRARGVPTVEAGGDPVALMDLWEHAGTAIVLDAVGPGSAPGRLRRIDATEEPLPANLGTGSTHLLGLAEAVELARALHSLPKRLVLHTVEGADFSTGTGLSPPVAAALDDLVDAVVAEVSAIGGA